MMWGPWGWGMGVGSLLFLALIVVGVVLLAQRPAGQAPPGGQDSARRILDERLARGEIDQEEYWRRRRTLEGSRE
jgi:putative membrane protein